MNRLSVLLVLFIVGCTNKKTNCTITADELFEQQGNKKLTIFSIKDRINKVINNGFDSTNGVYSFYKNGHLQHYRFFANSEAYTYSEEYNEDGQLIKTEGNPLVYNSTELKTKDSIIFELYFLDLQKQYGTVKVTTNANQSLNLILKDDSVFTNMKYGSFGINRKGFDHIRIYINTEYQSRCDSKMHALSDTIALGYTPPR